MNNSFVAIAGILFFGGLLTYGFLHLPVPTAKEPIFEVGDNVCYNKIPVKITGVYSATHSIHLYDFEYQNNIFTAHEHLIKRCVFDFDDYIKRKKSEN